jgi:CRP/FNR family transcriptional regulator, anaerobic regulatory protein
MSDKVIIRQLLGERFPLLLQEPHLMDEIVQAGQEIRLKRGFQIYMRGDLCQGISFLLDGLARVYRIAESGREITLYEVLPGETCILNAACILGRQKYPANAVVTQEAHAFLVPATVFRELLQGSTVLRQYVFELLSLRMTDLMELVEEVAFRRMDERLSDYLEEKSSNGVLAATHQTIAADLGTSREVVTRLLRDMEQQGLVKLNRGEILFLSLVA